ncbi:MAG: hypothetical protein NDJ89_18030 [Oligoflexia bacterium]|nr:hypothetical protein [Oligoflexia bacterium]
MPSSGKFETAVPFSFDGNPEWIPLMDYAIQEGISLSTLRRHIKAHKIPFKVENGRYLLPRSSEAPRVPVAAVPQAEGNAASAQVIHKLKLELQKAREEIAELKTLIAFYEERSSGSRLDV